MPSNRIRNWNPIGWAADHPRRATVLVFLIAFLIWTGQTYVWNPFFLTGYQYYPFVIFLTAGVLGKLLPHRKRPEKKDLEHTESSTQGPRTLSDPLPPPPLESLRDDNEPA